MINKKTKSRPQSFMVFQPGAISAPIGENQTVLDVALSQKLDIGHSCGGMGSCTTCLVRVLGAPSKISPRTELEQEMADDRGLKEDERLACQLEPCPLLEVEIIRHKKDS